MKAAPKAHGGKLRVTAVVAPKLGGIGKKAAVAGAGKAMAGAGKLLGAVGKRVASAAPRVPAGPVTGALSAGPMAPKLATPTRRRV